MGVKRRASKRSNGAPYTRVRIRPQTLRALKAIALMADVPWGDLVDEALQVGLGYIYERRRMNLGRIIPEIPEVWQQLDAKDIKSLRGTEYPPSA